MKSLKCFLSAFAIILSLLLLGFQTPAFAQVLIDSDFFRDPSSSSEFLLEDQDLVIEDAEGRIRIRLDAQGSEIFMFDSDGTTQTLRIDSQGNIFAGGGNQNNGDGDLVLVPNGKPLNSANASIQLNGNAASALFGGNGKDGQLQLERADGRPTVFIDGKSGQIISRANAVLGSNGIDAASIYIESINPGLAVLDTTGGNKLGFAMRTDRNGTLSFLSGDLNGITGRLLVLAQDGSVCLGACSN